MTEYDEKIDALAEVLDNVEVHVRAVDKLARRSERNRLSMLHLHAIAAVLIGPLFAGVGREGMAGATWTVTRMIPGAPFTLGAFLFLGGVILGTSTWFRHLRWEKLGLWMLLSWYATVSSSFAAALVLWTVDGGRGPRPSLYAPAVYAHLCGIMIVHLVTLSRMTRRRQPRS